MSSLLLKFFKIQILFHYTLLKIQMDQPQDAYFKEDRLSAVISKNCYYNYANSWINYFAQL